MAERKPHFSAGGALRASGIALALALLVDRIALYSWSYAVLSFYRSLASGWNNPVAVPLEKARPPWIFVNEAARGGYTLDLWLAGSWLSPTRVQLAATGELSVFFTPPHIAWCTHLFPRLGHGYELTYFTPNPATDARPPSLHLYRHARAARTEVMPGSVWPPLI